jgi:hypothetical protein
MPATFSKAHAAAGFYKENRFGLSTRIAAKRRNLLYRK